MGWGGGFAGLGGATLIHHRLNRLHPFRKAQHANTISPTAGHLTSTSLTRLHANSITANAAPLTNASVTGVEILWLCGYHSAAQSRAAAWLMPRIHLPKRLNAARDGRRLRSPPGVLGPGDTSESREIAARLRFHISHRRQRHRDDDS